MKLATLAALSLIAGPALISQSASAGTHVGASVPYSNGGGYNRGYDRSSYGGYGRGFNDHGYYGHGDYGRSHSGLSLSLGFGFSDYGHADYGYDRVRYRSYDDCGPVYYGSYYAPPTVVYSAPVYTAPVYSAPVYAPAPAYVAPPVVYAAPSTYYYNSGPACGSYYTTTTTRYYYGR